MPVKTTVTGVVQDPAGNVATSGYVTFKLIPGSPSQPCRVAGTTVVAPMTVNAVIDSNGQVKATDGVSALEIWGNDLLDPANSNYQVSYAPDGEEAQVINGMLISGATYDLSSPVFAPEVTINPVSTPLHGPPVEGNLIPLGTDTFNVGTSALRYSEGHFAEIFADNINLANPISADSVALAGYLEANLPVKGVGVLARVTDNRRGTWKSLGSGYWSPVFPYAQASEFGGVGADASTRIALAIASVSALVPVEGSAVVDATSLVDSQSITASIVVSCKILLKIGPASYDLSNVGDVFTYTNSANRSYVFVQGAGIDKTAFIISGTTCLNFDPAFGSAGAGISDIKIQSDSLIEDPIRIGSAANVTSLFKMERVTLYGPGGASGGTSSGIYVLGCNRGTFRDVWVYNFPKYNWKANGNYGGENTFFHISGNSAGDWNWYFEATQDNFVGGWSIDNYSVFSNTDLIPTCKGAAWVSPAGLQITGMNIQMINTFIDRNFGGDGIWVKGMVHTRIIGGQIDSVPSGSAPAFSAGIHLEKCLDTFIQGMNIGHAGEACIWLEDDIYQCNINGNSMAGDPTKTYGVYIESPSANKGYIDVGPISTASAPYDLKDLTNDYAMMAAVSSPAITGAPNAFGWSVRGDIKIAPTVIGATPNKYIRSTAGVLQFLNNSGAVSLQLGDEGNLYIPGHANQYAGDQWSTTVTITAGNVTETFTMPVGYTFPPTVQLTAGGNLGGRDMWYTKNAAQVTVHISSALGVDLDIDITLTGNPY